MKLSSLATVLVFAAIAIFAVYVSISNAASDGADYVALEVDADKDQTTAKTPAEYRRTPDQTFLTFPEWFLVHSPQEYADYLGRNELPSGFPFFRHIGQFWQSYVKVYQVTDRHFPFNGEYHTMIAVIGVSTTIEYFLKGAYETIVGRLTELLAYPSAEDRVAAKEAKDYVDFIKVEPWYKFDFIGPAKEVWQDNGLFSGDVVRKLDRKYLLTTEFLIKWVYGKLIWKATASSFDVPVPTTAVITSGDVVTAAPAADVTKVKTLEDGSVLWTLPRYAAFTDRSMEFAKAGAEFQEVAGNRGTILVSALVPSDWRPRSTAFDVLFSQPMITKPAQKRLALIVPIRQLASVLRAFDTPPLQVEHVYDF